MKRPSHCAAVRADTSEVDVEAQVNSAICTPGSRRDPSGRRFTDPALWPPPPPYANVPHAVPGASARLAAAADYGVTPGTGMWSSGGLPGADHRQYGLATAVQPERWQRARPLIALRLLGPRILPELPDISCPGTSRWASRRLQSTIPAPSRAELMPRPKHLAVLGWHRMTEPQIARTDRATMGVCAPCVACYPPPLGSPASSTPHPSAASRFDIRAAEDDGGFASR